MNYCDNPHCERCNPPQHYYQQTQGNSRGWAIKTALIIGLLYIVANIVWGNLSNNQPIIRQSSVDYQAQTTPVAPTYIEPQNSAAPRPTRAAIQPVIIEAVEPVTIQPIERTPQESQPQRVQVQSEPLPDFPSSAPWTRADHDACIALVRDGRLFELPQPQRKICGGYAGE